MEKSRLNDQTKQKIEAWVEKEKVHRDGTPINAFDEAALRRAIIFGLELGKEAGPKMRDEDGGTRDDEKGTRCRKHEEIKCQICYGYNLSLTAKNAAIQGIIDEMKV